MNDEGASLDTIHRIPEQSPAKAGLRWWTSRRDSYFPIRSSIFSISSITRFIFFIVSSKGSEVVMSTPAFFNKLIA